MRRSLKYWQKRLIRQRLQLANQTLASISGNTRHDTNQGFALPMALGMGLIMLLVGITMILRSQDDQVTASAQKATNRALGAAETGISRYQSFINNNRLIAKYPRTGNPSWTNPSSIPGINDTDSCGGNGIGSSTQVSSFASKTGWQDIDTNDSSRGQFRLVDYIYHPSGLPGTSGAPKVGQLTVDGRVNQVGTGDTATSNINTATTRLQVGIPVLDSSSLGVGLPAGWIATGDTGNNTIQGDFCVGDSSVPLSKINVTGNNPVTGKPFQASYTTLQFPSLPSKPSFPSSNVLGPIDKNFKGELTFPRSGDTATTKVINGENVQVYEYSVTEIDTKNKQTIEITPGKIVTFYLDGDINKGGDIVHTCGSVPGCKSTDFKILGYGATGSEICASGNDVIEAFIFAPQYKVGVAGSGGGKGGFRGSVWAKQWSNSSGCGSNTSNIVLRQVDNWSDISLVPINTPPVISTINSWQRQQVSN